MPGGDGQKQLDRGPTAAADKPDRAHRSSPFARWRSLREPRSSRAVVELDAPRSKDATDAVPQLRGEGDKLPGTGCPPVRATVAAHSSATTATATAAASPAPAQQQQQSLISSSRSLSSRQTEETVAGTGAVVSAHIVDGSSNAEPTALGPRGSHARRSLKTLFARSSASEKHKSAAALSPPQEEHLAEVDGGKVVASSSSNGSSGSGFKASRLPSIRRSAGKPIKPSPESLTSTSPPPQPWSASSATASTAAVLRGNSSKGQTLRDAASRGTAGAAARPASLNESHLRSAAVASSLSGSSPSRPSLSMSPVGDDVVGDHDWQSGVSLSSPSSSESSIAEKCQEPARSLQRSSELKQLPTARSKDSSSSSSAKEQAGTAVAAESVAARQQRVGKPGASIRQSHPLTPAADAVDASVHETRPFMNGHKSEEPASSADAPAELAAASAAVAAGTSVADANSVLKFLAVHSKMLNSISPMTKAAAGGTAEADIVLQLTEEVKLLKNGLIHCETVLREEEATRHRLERELLEKDEQIKRMHVLLSSCKCREECRLQPLQNGCSDGHYQDGGSPKDLT